MKNFIQKVVSSLLAFPSLLILAQLPEALLAIPQKFLESITEDQPVLRVLIFLPIFCVSSTLSNSLSFLLVLQHAENKRPSLPNAFSILKNRLPQVLLAYLVILAFFILAAMGLYLLILPALYFMAIYQFTPYLILTSEKMPLFAVLHRSQKMVRSSWMRLLNAMCLILSSIAMGIATYFAGQQLGELSTALTTNTLLQGVSSTTIDIFFSIIGGSIVSVVISHFFLNLRAQVNHEGSR